MRKLFLYFSLAMPLISHAAQPYDYSSAVGNPFNGMLQGISDKQILKRQQLENQRLELENKQLERKINNPNNTPAYGKTGLPSNCRAYIQYAVNSYRQGQYTAEDTMIGIERNCGINGQLW